MQFLPKIDIETDLNRHLCPTLTQCSEQVADSIETVVLTQIAKYRNFHNFMFFIRSIKDINIKFAR